MGGGNSKKQQVDLMMTHPKFQNAKLITEGDVRKIQTFVGAQQKEYDEWVQLQNQKPYPEFLLIPLEWSFSTKGLCGSTGTLSIFFQDYPYLLSQQISYRRGAKRFFNECDLWYLLYVLACAKRDIHKFYIKVGDIRPQNIFINQRGEIKISNRLSWPGSRDNFEKTLEGQTTYLAPEQMVNIESYENNKYNLETAEVFSIGMTLLSAATTTDLSYIYGPNGKKFDNKAASDKLNEWISNTNYSEILRATIANLCQFNPNARVNSEELANWVEKYQSKIKSRQNFVIQEAPQKLHDQVQNLRRALSLMGQSVNMIQNSRLSQQSPEKKIQSNVQGSPQRVTHVMQTRQTTFNLSRQKPEQSQSPTKQIPTSEVRIVQDPNQPSKKQ